MSPGMRFGGGRLIVALVIAAMSVLGYYSSRQFNPVTNENQHVSMSVDQEIAMGLQAAPELADQFGGLHPDAEARTLVERVGRRVVESSSAREAPYQYEFHLLADENTINAFALPGGQVFITAAIAAFCTGPFTPVISNTFTPSESQTNK